MAIQWFPGHMHLTRKLIEERVKDIDVVIEVLDARLPAVIVASVYYFWRRGILGTIVVGMAVYLPLHIGLGW